MGGESDIAVKEIRMGLRRFDYRTPMKFRGVVGTKATTLDVAVLAEKRDGGSAWGFGSMIMGNTWAFPSEKLDADTTLAVMLDIARHSAHIILETCREHRHPMDHWHAVEPRVRAETATIAEREDLGEPIPVLAALVAASPFDAAIHDAFGKANGVNVYECYGPDFASHDLSVYLDERFNGEYLDAYTLKSPRPRMPLYHLVGALDPLTDSEATDRVNDGLPETLEEWISADGLTHLKMKMAGRDLDWDIERILAVNAVAEAAAPARDWNFSVDFNERCENVEYLLEVLEKVRERAPKAFERIQYVEQPTHRDLAAHPENTMHAAAKIKPVVIDESLVDYESLLLSVEMGYSGVALKACKGQTQSLLMAAAARKLDLFLCVQDLTCTGPSYLHSVSLASRIPTVAAVEGNGRQYCPAANRGFAEMYPSTFKVEGGEIDTSPLTGRGLGLLPVGYVGEGLEPVE
ncbi:MAG: enolase C-terminal domain-like protein [Planctomycetota bacterium]|jgi:L-alanine-DL-glutamate epimerase-like enolase superfamily enzyme